MAEPVIRIEGLSKRFGRLGRSVVAVRDLSMTVERGTVVAFVGPNGAGKTTTIYAMLGLLKPSRGVIRLFGETAGSRAARRRLGFLSEIFYTYPFRTARSAMYFYGRLSELAADGLDARIVRQLERLGLGEAMDRRVGTFSKGMVQRLGLAQALLHEPELLILDEPTTGLDPEGRKLVADLIREEKTRGTTVFLSSHILSDVERSCDHVIMIRRGEVVLSEPIAGLGGDAWEVEVSGWRPELATPVEQAGFAVARQADGAAVVGCSRERKEELLRVLLGLPVGIEAVRRGRKSLEDLYMEHLGGSSSG